jgi:hypothetical protein
MAKRPPLKALPSKIIDTKTGKEYFVDDLKKDNPTLWNEFVNRMIDNYLIPRGYKKIKEDE